MSKPAEIAVIAGDGIGIEVTEASLAMLDQAVAITGGDPMTYREIKAGAGYFAQHGIDIEPGGEEAAGKADAIFLGAIGLVLFTGESRPRKPGKKSA